MFGDMLDSPLLRVLPLETWLSLSPQEFARTAVVILVTDFLIEHPYAAYKTEDEFVWTAEYRDFVLGLTAAGQPGEKMSTAELASATRVPPTILEEWLH